MCNECAKLDLAAPWDAPWGSNADIAWTNAKVVLGWDWWCLAHDQKKQLANLYFALF